MLSGNERALRFEEILPILHVQHRIACVAAIVTWWKIDGDRTREFLDPFEHALTRRATAILQP